MKQLRQQIQSARDSDDRKKVRELAGRRRKLMEKSGGRHAMKKKLAEILSPQQMQQFEKNMRELHRKMRSEKNKKSDRGKGPIAPQSNAEAKDGTKLDIWGEGTSSPRCPPRRCPTRFTEPNNLPADPIRFSAGPEGSDSSKDAVGNHSRNLAGTGAAGDLPGRWRTRCLEPAHRKPAKDPRPATADLATAP